MNVLDPSQQAAIFKHKIIDGRRVAAEMNADTARRAAFLTEKGFAPKLVSLTIGEVEAARLYVRNQMRVAERVGIAFDDRHYPVDTSADTLLELIGSLNEDPSVSGIIMQRPLPLHIPVKAIQRAIHPTKDVEGMHPASIGNIVYNDLVMSPCTANAAVELLKRCNLDLKGLEVCVIGHSEIVGKPIAFLLMSEGATVTVCHHMTRNLAVHSRASDAVFVAVGKAGLVTGDMIKPGSVLIDIGINQITLEDGSTRVVGDADFESCAEIAGWITPVPGGVGPVTVAMLMRNNVRSCEIRAGLRSD